MSAPNPRVVLFGECMIELRHESESLMRQSFSGDTLNTAVYLARLAGGNYQVNYATAIGQGDPFSEAMLANWAAEGIATGFVSRRTGELPGIYTIQVDAKGERNFSYWRQNSAARNYFNDAVSPLEQQIGQIDVFYFSGISLAILPDVGRARLFAFLQALRERGKMIVFDNNYRARLWPSSTRARHAYTQAYALADIGLVTLSDEMEIDGQTDEAEAVERLFGYPCKELVIKRGGKSTLVRLADGSRYEIPVEQVATVVDTTAAGDSFGAAYLATRLHGKTPEQAARAGNRLAATVIRYPGAIITVAQMPAMP